MVCLALLTVALPAMAAPRVEMSVQAANEGRVKQGGWVTVIVDLVNRGGETSGELVVEADDERPHAQYVVPYVLPAGGRKRIPVSLPGDGNFPVLVKLYAGGELAHSERVPLTWLPPQSTMVGILSGDEWGIPALNQFQAFQGQSAQVVRLSAATLPDRAPLLADFNVIALSRFDSASLTPAQLRALEVWVGQGGTLLLAGGPEWKRTLAALPPSLVPVEVTGVRPVAIGPLGDLAARPLTGSAMVSEGRLTSGQALISSDGVPLVASASVGAGRVLFLAFDPGLDPVANWAGQPEFFNRLLASAGLNFGYTQEWSWALQEALQRIPNWGLPRVLTVAALLLSYLLLVGPVNYLVLKRLDRREWGWFTVPATSLLFLGLVYFIGFGRYEPLISHLITVTELAPGTGSAAMTAHVGIYAPSLTRLSVAVEDARLVQPYIRGPQSERVIARVVAGERAAVDLLGLSNYAMSGFSVEQEIAVTGGLALTDARVQNNELTARLTNRLDQAVTNIEVAVAGSAEHIDRLEPGQTSEPFTLPLGDVGGRLAPGQGFAPNRPAVEGGEEVRMSLVRDYVFNTAASRAGAGVLVAGWTEQPLAAPRLHNVGKLVQGANMVWSILPLPLGGEGADIPAGMVLGRPVDPQQVDWLPGGYMLRPGTHDFTLLLPPLDPAKVAAVELEVPMVMTVKAAVKNQKTGEWLPVTDSHFPLPAWREFVSPVGLIDLRLESREHLEMQPPTVAVKGVGR